MAEEEAGGGEAGAEKRDRREGRRTRQSPLPLERDCRRPPKQSPVDDRLAKPRRARAAWSGAGGNGSPQLERCLRIPDQLRRGRIAAGGILGAPAGENIVDARRQPRPSLAQ